MTNLFTVFEPSSSIMNFPLNWLAISLIILLYPHQLWLKPNTLAMLPKKPMINFLTEIKLPSSNITVLLSPLIMLITANNFMGLMPYIFTASSHMSFTMTLAFPLWLGLMSYALTTQLSKNMEHLTPQGTPTPLIPLMVIIETISNIIRPFTLSIRLSANMIAGHLLLTLSGNSGPSLTLIKLPSLIILQSPLLILEFAVSFIQAYVFTTLLCLYLSETT